MTHWKKLTNPKYLGAYEILTLGTDLILTIKSVSLEMVKGEDGKEEQCVVLKFVEPEKPMILNKTNMKQIEKIHKTPDIEQWPGKKIQIYSARVKAFGDIVDALRIRPTVPKEVEIICEDCKKSVTAVGKFTAQQVADTNKKTYGRVLCGECSRKLKEAAKNDFDGK